MLSRASLVWVILLPLVGGAGADETEEQIFRKVIYEPHHLADILSPHQPAPVSPSLLLHLLRVGSEPGSTTTNNNNNADSSSSEVTDSEVRRSKRSEEEEDRSDEILVKRVFCNGFTGCGGRHRDRSRRQERYGKRLIPVLAKRPFCNPHGCYNGKRAQSPAAVMETTASLMDPQTPARLLAEYLAFAQRENLLTPVPGKRPFCNGYGGCRGGKRTVFSNWLNKMNSVVKGTR